MCVNQHQHNTVDQDLHVQQHIHVFSFLIHLSQNCKPHCLKKDPLTNSIRPLSPQRLYLFAISSSGTPPSCIDLFVAALTAEIVAERKPLRKHAKRNRKSKKYKHIVVRIDTNNTLKKVRKNRAYLTHFPALRLLQLSCRQVK